MCKAQDHSQHDSHKIVKVDGEINKSSGFHFLEFHSQSAGMGILIFLGFAFAAFALYRIYVACNRRNRNRDRNASNYRVRYRSQNDDDEFERFRRERERRRDNNRRDFEEEHDRRSYFPGPSFPTAFPFPPTAQFPHYPMPLPVGHAYPVPPHSAPAIRYLEPPRPASPLIGPGEIVSLPTTPVPLPLAVIPTAASAPDVGASGIVPSPRPNPNVPLSRQNDPVTGPSARLRPYFRH